MRFRRIVFFCFLPLLIHAGTVAARPYSCNDTLSRFNHQERLNVNQDERLDELVLRHIKINSKREGIQGYRIRIFSESGQSARPNATEIRAGFYDKYPDIETYLIYDAPNFKVYVGDFRTRSEALKMQRKISRDYPYSFIISDRINFPDLD